jgi:hypothetical protein
MQYLICFCSVIILSSSAFLFSCTKNAADTSNTQQEILIRHKWKHYQTRTISIDTITNTIIKDSLYIVDSCYQNSLYAFATDSVVRRNFICFAAPSEKEGRWYLKADSAFAASIMIRTSYGTGYILQDFGLPYGKMKLLTETDFQLLGIYYNGFSPIKYYNTLYLKAVN